MRFDVTMKFDASRKDGVIGIALTSTGGAYGFATAVMQVIDPATLGLTSSILLIVAAILFGAGAISLVLNSKEIGDNAAVDASTSFLIQAIFILSMFLVVLGGIFVAL